MQDDNRSPALNRLLHIDIRSVLNILLAIALVLVSGFAFILQHDRMATRAEIADVLEQVTRLTESSTTCSDDVRTLVMETRSMIAATRDSLPNATIFHSSPVPPPTETSGVRSVKDE